MSDANPPVLSPGERRRVILILGALSTITPLSIDMYLPAFGAIARSLHCTTAQVSLSVSSYFIGLSASARSAMARCSTASVAGRRSISGWRSTAR